MSQYIRALSRARLPVLIVASAYAVSIAVGAFMVHGGNPFALRYRDDLVGTAARHDPAAIADIEGSKLKAVLWDFGGNLVYGALPKSLSGMSVVLAFPLVAYQGWIGGIVSVRGDHSSRLDDPRSAFYYLFALFLQVVPYSIATGAGINVGMAMLRPPPWYQGEKWARIFPREALLDLARVYVFVIPLFLVASLWEFLSTWNF